MHGLGRIEGDVILLDPNVFDQLYRPQKHSVTPEGDRWLLFTDTAWYDQTETTH